MATQAVEKIPRLLSLYCFVILCYAYSAVKVKRLSSRTFVEQRQSIRLRRQEGQERSAPGTANGIEQRGSKFVTKFEEIISSNEVGNLTAKFAAILIRDGKVYCRSSHTELLSRGRHLVQMLQQGLRTQQQDQNGNSFDYDLPIILKHDDSSGCNPATNIDAYKFPRLTWAVPMNNTANQWCNVVGVPSYKTWKNLNKQVSWDSVFKHNAKLYPWSDKMKRAVWRGSTTSNKGIYGDLELDETPRGILVNLGINNSLFDVGFHKVVGKCKQMKHRTERRKAAIPLEEMMKYKAIIDIDGNNWSARFNTLLCFNSVVVKVTPDFMESNFQELVPHYHYLPSTLDNITQVIKHVIAEGNDAQIRQIVANANNWCKENMNRKKLAKSAIEAIKSYKKLLNDYDEQWHNDWYSSIVVNKIDDLEECAIR